VAVMFHSSVCPQPACLVIERFHCPLLERHLPQASGVLSVLLRCASCTSMFSIWPWPSGPVSYS
jgi:hypothetical protein